MFSHFPDKELIKQKCREMSNNDQNTFSSGTSGTPHIRCSDQFPPAIQERRRKLIPTMIKARQDGKTAYISYDKLIINGQAITVDTVSLAGYS
ncbi:hypothetical protein DPMN_165340 [Dreissena polymorpha]|uniref:Uncharacterized protein n=1 Tax=Dreissena polymorpha TaxID=45954 RepID=A0A9D4IUI4_DREPO|nr:hypothetical protein DPMN_165340 [Dreissena polymorpha]